MPTHFNEFQQPVGQPMPAWQTRSRPERVTRVGRLCRIEPLSAARHAADLYAAYASAPDDRDWTYMPVGPFPDAAQYHQYALSAEASQDPFHFAIIDLASERAVGTLALMRIDPANGVIEVGSVTFSPALKRTALSTEAQYLLMSYVFDDLGYRRYEWKCDSANAPSRTTAERLGFTFEGIFRQAIVYKGRNRDTAWFSILDSEWPRLRHAFQAWLAPDNFDQAGQQRAGLAALR